MPALILAGCDQFEYHPYSVEIHGKNDINTKNIARLESSGIKAPFKFAFISDTQGSLDEMSEALELIKSMGDIEFIIHGGDMTDFGLPKEFIWTRDILEGCGLPYLSVIGNHDCLGNGEDTFNYIFGPENFSLNINCVHIVGLNTIALEYDYSKPVPDLNYIEEDIIDVNRINTMHPDSLTHTVVAMHSRPYDEQFNNNIAKPFNRYIEEYPGMTNKNTEETEVANKTSKTDAKKGFCVNGHNHTTDVSDLFGNGIIYYQCANIGKRSFFIFTITKEGYEYETIEF